MLNETVNKRILSEVEDARIGYQVAVDLARSNIEYVWSIFNALIVANSIVIAAISLLMMSELQLAIARYSLPIVGLTLCTIWWFIVKHARERAVYYTLSARELEERYLSPNVKTLSRGGDFANKEAITLEISGEQINLRLSILTRLINGHLGSNIIGI
jgi:hypothetical protein